MKKCTTLNISSALIRSFCLIFSLFFLSDLSAKESKPLIIDADFVDYDGKLINLNGNSRVDHELGIVEAQRIVLRSEAEEQKLRFAYLKMQDGVKIALQDGGQLCCGEAELDYHTLTGKFSGRSPEEYVIYTENLKGSNPKGVIPLEVKSLDMHLYLKQEDQQSSSSLSISKIKADHHVSVNYNNDFLATADHGFYERRELTQEKSRNQKNEDLKSNLLPSSGNYSLLSLYANEQSGTCQVINRNGDLIIANKISIDTLKRELQFDLPKGSLYTQNASNKNEIHFSCETMTWHEPEDLLILHNQVEINYNDLGTLINPYEIRVSRQMIEGYKQVSQIESLGESVFSYQDEKKHENHVLSTYSKFTLDLLHQLAHLESPRDANNNVLENLQVHFNDATGEIFADEAFIIYKEVNKKMRPVKLLLKGNVWLLNRTSIDKDDPGKILQFAMADRVEYDLEAKEILCMADFSKRVLFFDKSNNLQVSAPSVKAKRDLHTQKESIQGMGDVRFSFIEKEFDQLKKRFGDRL